MRMDAVGDHLRLVDDARDGDDTTGAVYRIVGENDELTLLRVTDADGRRRYSGELRQLDRATVETTFEPTPNPDHGFALRHRLRTVGAGAYWSVRQFLP